MGCCQASGAAEPVVRPPRHKGTEDESGDTAQSYGLQFTGTELPSPPLKVVAPPAGQAASSPPGMVEPPTERFGNSLDVKHNAGNSAAAADQGAVAQSAQCEGGAAPIRQIVEEEKLAQAADADHKGSVDPASDSGGAGKAAESVEEHEVRVSVKARAAAFSAGSASVVSPTTPADLAKQQRLNDVASRKEAQQNLNRLKSNESSGEAKQSEELQSASHATNMNTASTAQLQSEAVANQGVESMKPSATQCVETLAQPSAAEKLAEQPRVSAKARAASFSGGAPVLAPISAAELARQHKQADNSAKQSAEQALRNFKSDGASLEAQRAAQLQNAVNQVTRDSAAAQLAYEEHRDSSLSTQDQQAPWKLIS